MCYHVSVQESVSKIAAKLKRKLKPKQSVLFTPGFHLNGFQKVGLPVISNISRDTIDIYQWGLIPNWVSNLSAFKANTLNARSADIFNKPSYREYWQNRCLIYVNGFFEPHYKILTDKDYESWYIKPAKQDYFFLAGIYNVWNQIPTVTILTKTGSEKMSFVHNDGERQPLIFDAPQAKSWINDAHTKASMMELMNFSYPDENLITYRTIDGIMHSRQNTNVPEAVLPYMTSNN